MRKSTALMNRETCKQPLMNFTGGQEPWTVEKCLVMHCGKNHHEYFIDGKRLATTMRAKDLGVVMSPDSRFRERTREAVNKAARQMNFISRSFVISDTDVYMKLFQTYVIPIVTYCSTVWSPRFEKDKKLIQSVFNRFRRRVAYKCQKDKEKLPRIDVDLVLSGIDQKMYASILKNPIFRDLLFDVVKTKTRSACTYRPKFVAKNHTVNNFFPWRVRRS